MRVHFTQEHTGFGCSRRYTFYTFSTKIKLRACTSTTYLCPWVRPIHPRNAFIFFLDGYSTHSLTHTVWNTGDSRVYHFGTITILKLGRMIIPFCSRIHEWLLMVKYLFVWVNINPIALFCIQIAAPESLANTTTASVTTESLSLLKYNPWFG